MDGSPAEQGSFTVRHGGQDHCTIQISDIIIVMTGGFSTETLVTEYQLDNGKETPLTSMIGDGRESHACSVYKDADGQQVRKLFSAEVC